MKKPNKGQVCFVAGRVIDDLIKHAHEGHLSSRALAIQNLSHYAPMKFRKLINTLKRQLKSGKKFDATVSAHELHRKMVAFCMGRKGR